MKILNRKLRKSLHKLAYLEDEYLEISEICDVSKQEINSVIVEIFARIGASIPVQESQEREKQEEESVSEDPTIKIVFRKIAAKIHPDKLVNLADDLLRLKYEKAYQDASRVSKAGDIVRLIEIALDLDIDPGVDDVTQISSIEKKIESLTKSLQEMQGSAAYMWSNNRQNDAVLVRFIYDVIRNLNVSADIETILETLRWMRKVKTLDNNQACQGKAGGDSDDMSNRLLSGV